MNLRVEIQRASGMTAIPGDEALAGWAHAAAEGLAVAGELVIRIVDEQESAELNGRYRNKSDATNVLSFPADVPAQVEESMLGDLVICAPVVQREAVAQGKPATAHWAHMVVHGMLHLCGYDHMNEAGAEEMEDLETAILNRLGFPDPYRESYE